MLNSFELVNFKGFRSTRLNGLAPVNLITGGNNVGKTALLEALAIFARRGKISVDALSLRYPNFHPNNQQEWCRWLFRDDGDRTLLLSEIEGRRLGVALATANGLGQASAELRQYCASAGVSLLAAEKDARIRAAYVNVHDYNLAVVACWPLSRDAMLQSYETVAIDPDAEHRIEAWLSALDGRIRGVRSLAPAGSPRELYVDVGGKSRIALAHLGQGTNRLLQIATKALAAKQGVLLIDEIDIGIHHQFLPVLWRAVFSIAKDLEIQLFLTTHSYECLQVAASVASEIEGSQLAMHRLERRGEDIEVVSGDEDMLIAAIKSGFEVR